MMIDTSLLNPREFHVRVRDDRTLICPTMKKWTWRDDEVHLRSLVLRDGRVISSGFPKFFNYGEKAHYDRVIAEAVANGEAFITEKLDGTLIIRDVWNRQVNFRTRDQFDLGPFEERVMRLVREKYPLLLDPAMGKTESLLFEYVGPENHNILRYEEPALYGLGYMLLGEWPPRPVIEQAGLLALCKVFRVSLPEIYLDSGSLDDLRERVRAWSDREGVVVRGPGTLLKVKSAAYLRLHAIKHQLSEKRLRELMWHDNVRTMWDFEKLARDEGWNEEILMIVRPQAERYLIDRYSFQEKLNELRVALAREGVFKDGLSRKEQIERARRCGIAPETCAVLLDGLEEWWIGTQLIKQPMHIVRKMRENKLYDAVVE